MCQCAMFPLTRSFLIIVDCRHGISRSAIPYTAFSMDRTLASFAISEQRPIM